MMEKEIVTYINETFSLEINEYSYDNIKNILASKINDLIKNDFNKLIQLLYRIDIDEIKLKKLLKDKSDMDAADTIALLIIERQIQKIKYRQRSGHDSNYNEEEKW